MLPSTFSLTASAQADTNISVNFGFGSFYDGLQPYGNWVYYQDQYVFLPQNVGYGWRPYTLGHWAFTRQYGWLWVSDERFGWATYHYGRWGYSRDIGWYWVPGRRWAPAWVAWSRGDEDVAWAPLPPRYGDDVNVNISFGDVPDYYWQAVPTSAFLSINLSNSFIRDRDHVRTIIQQRPPQTVHIENNIVVNNVIQVNDIERATNRKVPILTEKPVNNPNAVGKRDQNSVAIFNPDVKPDAGMKPKKAFKVDEVIADRKARGIRPQDAPSDPVVVPGQPPDKNTVVPFKPSDKGAPKGDSQGKVDMKKGKDFKPPINQPPVMDAPVTKMPPQKPPMVKAPPVDQPMPMPKRNKPAFNPPMNNGNGNDAPILRGDQFNKKKGGDMMPPPNIQKNMQPPPNGQPPKDQNFGGKKPPENKGRVPCDPKLENCPPVQ